MKGLEMRAVLVLGDGQRAAPSPEGLVCSAVCSYVVDGPFSGVSRLLLQLAEAAEARGHGDLIATHDAALHALSPALGRRYPPRFPMLTVSVRNDEGVRMLSPEWVTRYANGAVDFLFALQDRLGGCPVQLGLVDVEQGGPALMELLRQLARRGCERRLLLWLQAQAEPPVWGEICRYLPGEVLVGEKIGGDRPLPAPAGPDEAAMAWEIRELLAQGERKAAFAQLDQAIAFFLRAGFTRDALRYARWWQEELKGEPSIAMLNRLASALTVLGEGAAAEEAICQALALEPSPRTRAGLLYARAMLYTRFTAQPDLDRAMALIEEAIDALGQQPAPDGLAFYQNGLALVLLRQGRAAEALAVCQKALAHLTANSEPEQFLLQKMVLTHNIGRVHMQMGNPAAALDCLSEVMAHDPYYMELYQERGGLLMRLGRPQEALADFQQGLEFGPPSPQLFACCGSAATALGDSPRAESYYSRSLELDQEFAPAYKGRALSRFDQIRLAEALADYDAYLERRPADAEALCNRGSLRHDLGDLDGALADLDEAVRLDPRSVAALVNRVAVLADLQRHAEALADIEQALALDPSNETIRQNRAYLLAAVGE